MTRRQLRSRRADGGHRRRERQAAMQACVPGTQGRAQPRRRAMASAPASEVEPTQKPPTRARLAPYTVEDERAGLHHCDDQMRCGSLARSYTISRTIREQACQALLFFRSTAPQSLCRPSEPHVGDHDRGDRLVESPGGGGSGTVLNPNDWPADHKIAEGIVTAVLKTISDVANPSLIGTAIEMVFS
jgi:hypothetical protein